MKKSLEDLVTVIITTSPVVSHPSLRLLEETLASFKHVPELHRCPKTIVADGTRLSPADDNDVSTSEPDTPAETHETASSSHPSCSTARRKYANRAKAMRSGYVDEEYASRYGAMKRALSARVSSDAGKEWHPTEAAFAGVRLLFLDERVGYGFALRAALAQVTTRLVVVVQHDRTWMRACAVGNIVDAMEASVAWSMPDGAERSGCEPVVRCVSLVTRSTVNYIKRAQGRRALRQADLDLEQLVWRPPELRNGLRDDFNSQPFLAPLLQFYDSTHIAYTTFYTKFVFDPRLRLVARGGFVEDRLGASMMASIKRDGLVRGHGRYGVYLYDDTLSFANEGGGSRNAHRSRDVVPLVAHLDGGSFVTDVQRVVIRAHWEAAADTARTAR